MDAARPVPPTNGAHDELANEIVAVLREASTELQRDGSNFPAKFEATVEWYEPTGPGSHSGRAIKKPIVDRLALRTVLFPEGKKCRWGVELARTVGRLLAPHRTGVVMFLAANDQSVEVLLLEYFARKEDFKFDEKLARRVASEFCECLVRGGTRYRSLSELTGFSAATPLTLGGEVVVRPITMEDIETFAVKTMIFRLFGGGSKHVPYSDSWLVEVTATERLGKCETHNRLYAEEEKVVQGLRSLAGGTFSVTPLVRWHLEPYFTSGMVGGGLRSQYNSARGRLELSAADCQGIGAWWARFNRAMSKESHFLQVAVRRLAYGGLRTRPEDAIIDYCIGLESLLAAQDMSEIKYKFSVRGSVIVSQSVDERHGNFKKLGDLYKCRSKIVHGGFVGTAGELVAQRDTAEDTLRRVIQWYLGREGMASVGEGVDEIDRALGLMT